ncbi:hypothetical protein [Streptomyces olivaceus]|nr:hypothetical protein [Streptomyces olivaceus]
MNGSTPGGLNTLSLVSPGDATQGVTKDVAVDITTKLRKEIRVEA